jgi:hypothetical protein
MAKRPLGAGFTGEIEDKTALTARTRSAAKRVSDEAGMVAAHAVDHPVMTGSAVAAASLLAFAFGYLLGSASSRRHGYWHR